MEEKKVFLRLQDLDVYKLAKELSETGWEIYSGLHWQIKKITGDQFIESTDSVGANIAEGYHRFHFLDKIKFYYNSRASLVECVHWAAVLEGRGQIGVDIFDAFNDVAEKLSIKLQNFISSTYRSRDKLSR